MKPAYHILIVVALILRATKATSEEPIPVTINAYGSCADGTLERRVQELEARVDILMSFPLNGLAQDNPYMSAVPRDCRDIYNTYEAPESGIYQITPVDSLSFNVYCHFDEDGEWILVQNRVNQLTSFDRPWSEYKKGFGTMDVEGNYWLGLDHLHAITMQQQFTMRMDITDWEGTTKYAEYNYWQVGSEEENYFLDYQGYFGTAGDALSNFHMETQFSTFDRDNDQTISMHCARSHHGGWWYNNCDHANLNGIYYTQPERNDDPDTGIEWDAWQEDYSFKATRMRIKPTWEN